MSGVQLTLKVGQHTRVLHVYVADIIGIRESLRHIMPVLCVPVQLQSVVKLMLFQRLFAMKERPPHLLGTKHYRQQTRAVQLGSPPQLQCVCVCVCVSVCVVVGGGGTFLGLLVSTLATLAVMRPVSRS